MTKSKYRYNPHTLSYDKLDTNFWKSLKKLIPHLLSILFLTLILYFVVFSYFIDSPKESKLKRENNQLKAQFTMLSDRMNDMEKVLANIQYRDANIYRTIFEAEPIPAEVREAGYGGANRYIQQMGFENSDLIIETTKKLDQIERQLYVQSVSYDEVVELAKNKEKFLECVPAIQPILNKELTRVASHFGYRNDPVYRGTTKMHEGIDFTAPTGTDIYATGSGIIKEINYSRRGYGNQIVIDHGFGYSTRYAHLNKIFVRPGQLINRGDIIGQVGNSGKSVGPHLHYEVRKGDRAINPINFFYQDLTPEEYDKMIEFSSLEGGQSLD